MKKIRIIFIFLIFVVFLFAKEKIINIAILHTNDIHGNIGISKAEYVNPDFPPTTGNLASIKTIIKNFNKYINADEYILVDAGDFFQGTTIGNLSRGEAVIEVFNMVGYDLIVPGNHDFDFGFENLKELINKSKVPFICCNVVDENNNLIFKPYLIKEKKGIKIGIIGVLTEEMPRLSIGKNISGLKFLNVITETKKYVELLREKEKCDVIIVVSHLGFEEDKELAKKVSGIDIIIGGHSHTGVSEIYEDAENHTLVTQAYSKGGTLGCLILKISEETKKINGYKNELITLFEDLYPAEEEIIGKIKEWEEKVEKGFDDIIGTAKNNLIKSEPESNLGNLICDAIRTRYNADVAFQNMGGIRSDIKKGKIKVRDIFNVLPFDNYIVLIKMSGAELLEALEISVEGSHGILQVSGIEMVYNPKLPKYKRIKSAKVNGKEIDKNKEYLIVTNSYITESEGTSYSVFKQAKYIENTYDVLRDVVIEYIKAKKEIEVEIEGRIKISK
ncbi:MAG TPA: bifunctional UDP-sugar hydrolase/5'-nucleotidase [bacterium]|nr:bifunctional UDP-sugar hydrolase/5'-nucleotidase [bacterium]HOL47697.1 bifunctional UDP-sugar hydrolase/5'-nucleotidase [bacterium]HPQ19267.1 bifunctional UDP-sugar hydrolase/5'-nucleotidase [bacterium]